MRKRKFVSAAALIMVCVMLSMTMSACKTTETDVLTVYNWADYIYDYEDDFKQYYKEKTGRDITVTYVTFDTNETMLTKIMKGDSKVDVMCPSEYAIQRLVENGLLMKMNYFTDERFENSGKVNSAIVEKIRGAFNSLEVAGEPLDITEYFVPYMYGTLGILYNKDYFGEIGVTEEAMTAAGWGVLFNKNENGECLSEELNNRIFMKDSIRDSYAATLFYLLESGKLDGIVNAQGTLYTDMPIGRLINEVDDTLLELTKSALVEQKKILYGYEVDFGKNDLIQGNAYVDLAWSGDALYAIEESWDDKREMYTLGYFAPEVAGNIWFDGWVIPKDCVNVEQAKIFIDFLNRPYVAAQNMLEICYTSAVAKEEVWNDIDAMAVLCEAYNVNAPEYWTPENYTDEWEFDYDDIDEFSRYFFDDSARYPDVSDQTLGVMQDFGTNNQKVAAMWESVRSTGVTAWALLLWTLLAAAVAAGIIAAVYFINLAKKMHVKVAREDYPTKS